MAPVLVAESGESRLMCALLFSEAGCGIVPGRIGVGAGAADALAFVDVGILTAAGAADGDGAGRRAGGLGFSPDGGSCAGAGC